MKLLGIAEKVFFFSGLLVVSYLAFATASISFTDPLLVN